MSFPRIGILLLLSLPASAAAQVSLPTEQQIQLNSDVSVPLLEFGGRPVVEASINNRGPFRFIVDTGASANIIDDALIDDLKLTPGSGADAGPAVAGRVAIGALNIRDVAMARGGAMVASIAASAAGAPRGVLSAEGFPGLLLTFDFPGKRLLFRTGALPAPDGRRVFEYDAGDPLPRVPVRIDGKEFHLHIDTGAPTTMSLPLKIAGTLGLEEQLVERGRARVVTGTFPVYEAPFTGRVEVGEFVLPLAAISFSDLRPGPQEPPGLIGMKLLSAFSLTIDAKNRRVRFER